MVDTFGDFGFVPSPDADPFLFQSKRSQDINKIIPFIGEIVLQDSGSVLPFMQFVMEMDEIREMVQGHL